jgi:midasin (ATPase involved in ribosome maturation)
MSSIADRQKRVNNLIDMNHCGSTTFYPSLISFDSVYLASDTLETVSEILSASSFSRLLSLPLQAVHLPDYSTTR